MAERQKADVEMPEISTTLSSHNSKIPPRVPVAGRCAKLFNRLPPRNAATYLSTLSSFVSCKHTIWHEESTIVALTVALLAGQLSPRTFHLRVLTGCDVIEQISKHFGKSRVPTTTS